MSCLGKFPRALCAAWALTLAWLVGAQALAHPLSPASIVLIEQTPGTYQVRFRRPEPVAPLLQLELPASCRRGNASSQRVRDQLEDTFELACADGLTGQALFVRGLSALSTSAIVYAEFVGGERVRGLLSAAEPSFIVPASLSPQRVFVDYLELGIEHLLAGADHLLFLLGLIFLAPHFKSLLWTLTAFTLGHSLTLCLLALSLVQVNGDAVEVGIALSLVALALSLLTPSGAERAKGGRRNALPWLAMALGLLHGLGFAGALAETGLPEHQIPLSLIGFNLGIECAQLLVVLVVSGFARFFPHAVNERAQRVAAYAIGAVSAMWCIERSLAWFS